MAQTRLSAKRQARPGPNDADHSSAPEKNGTERLSAIGLSNDDVLRESAPKGKGKPKVVPRGGLKTSPTKRLKVGISNQASTVKQCDSPLGFKIASRPTTITRILNLLTTNQKNAITEIGFGGLLEMKYPKFPDSMHGWLVESFNPDARAMMYEGIPLYHITPADICDVFLLPYCPENPVDQDLDVTVRQIRGRWETEFHFSCQPQAKTQLKKLQETMLKEDGGADFKRMFVLYVLSGFLAPVSNGTVDFRPLKSLVNTAVINKYDWCGFVLDKLCASTKRFKGGPNIQQKATYSGCILLLLISYMQRLIWQGIPSPRTRPFIRNWTPESIYIRIKEQFAAGGFGKWPLDIITYPITRVLESHEPSSSNKPTISFLIPEDLPDDATLEKTIPNGYERFVAKLSRDIQVVVGDRFETILKEDSLTPDMQLHHSYLEAIPYLSVCIDVVVEHFQNFKEKLLGLDEEQNSIHTQDGDGNTMKGDFSIENQSFNSSGEGRQFSTKAVPLTLHQREGSDLVINDKGKSRTRKVTFDIAGQILPVGEATAVAQCMDNSNPPVQDDNIIHLAGIPLSQIDRHVPQTFLIENGRGMSVSPRTIHTKSVDGMPGAEPAQPLPVTNNNDCADCLHSELPNSVTEIQNEQPTLADRDIPEEFDGFMNLKTEQQPSSTEHEACHQPHEANGQQCPSNLFHEVGFSLTTVMDKQQHPSQDDEEGGHSPVQMDNQKLPEHKLYDSQIPYLDVDSKLMAVTNEQEHPSTPESKEIPLSGTREEELPSPIECKERPWYDWPKNTEDIQMSTLVSRLITRSHTLTTHQLEIADFCISDALLDTYSNSSLYDDGILALQRIDFHPFEHREIISDKLINVWSRILNERSSDQCPGSHIYLAAAHWLESNDDSDDGTIVHQWESWLKQCPRDIRNAKLIFVPVEIDCHYFLLVFNFSTKIVQYLDSSIHRCMRKWDAASRAVGRKLRTTLLQHCCHESHDNAASVQNFKIQTIKGEWRAGSKKSNAGIYVMHLLNSYSGDPNSLRDFPIDQASYMDELRAYFCHQIVMNHANKKKDQLLSAVQLHIKEKLSHHADAM